MSKIGPPDCPEATKIAQAFVKAAAERLVWGSDWPHPSEQNGTLPDDALLFDLLAVWAREESTRRRILVEKSGDPLWVCEIGVTVGLTASHETPEIFQPCDSATHEG
jgi:hypothetical protein